MPGAALIIGTLISQKGKEGQGSRVTPAEGEPGYSAQGFPEVTEGPPRLQEQVLRWGADPAPQGKREKTHLEEAAGESDTAPGCARGARRGQAFPNRCEKSTPVLSAGSVESSDMRKSSSSLTARKMKSLSRVQLFVTPWTLTYQPPPSMGFSRQEYWSGLPFLSPISSQPRDRTRVSHIVGRCFTV